jgi:hypothetical protein
MTNAIPHDLGRLRRQLIDLMDVHPCEDWSPTALSAVIATVELDFAAGGTNKAPVLQLVKS